jgi:D-aminopeptidase
MTKVIAGASDVPVCVLDGDGVVWRAEEVDVAHTRFVGLCRPTTEVLHAGVQFRDRAIYAR